MKGRKITILFLCLGQYFLIILTLHRKYVAKFTLDFSHFYQTVELYGKVTLCPKREKGKQFLMDPS